MWRGIFLLVLLTQAVRAEPPRSAIDWLSESIQQPPNFVISPPGAVPNTLALAISSTPLDMVNRDSVGLLAPDKTGFPIAMWNGLASHEVIPLLEGVGAINLPEIAALYRQILLAQSDPPQNNGEEGALLLARIDQLFKRGALDEAETLVLLAGADEPDIFRRWFEITLIGQRTRAPCNALKEQPTLSTDVATRVICLARAGDWNAAAITVSLAESLGDIATADADLLVRFLDPEMFADLPDPGNPEQLDPITFTLRESLALPRPDGPLPLPYLNADMSLRTPARQRILAAERLVRASAIPPTLLFAAYRGARAASSGGAWGRAEAIQALDDALVAENDERLAGALTEAMVAFTEAGLFFAFAEEYADAVAHSPPGPETGLIAPELRKLLLLSGRPLAVWAGLAGEDTTNVQLATALASHVHPTGPAPNNMPIAAAIQAAFSNLTPARTELNEIMAQIESGHFGDVLLHAIHLLAKGRAADPRDLHEGLYLLRKLGLDAPARRAAIQLLLIHSAPT